MFFLSTRFPGSGRRVFGVAAVVLGAAMLVWGDFATNWHPVRATTPYRVALAYVAGVAFLVGGIATQWRRTQRAGLIALAVLYFLCALLWLPRMIGFPELFGVWSGFAEQFCIVAAVMFTLAATSSPVMPWARFLFGLCVLIFGMAHVTALAETAQLVPAWLPFGQRFWALVTGGAMFLAGLSIMSGLLAAHAAWAMTALLMSFQLFVWVPRFFIAPGKLNTWAGNATNLSVTAAAWMVAEMLTRLMQKPASLSA